MFFKEAVNLIVKEDGFRADISKQASLIHMQLLALVVTL